MSPGHGTAAGTDEPGAGIAVDSDAHPGPVPLTDLRRNRAALPILSGVYAWLRDGHPVYSGRAWRNVHAAPTSTSAMRATRFRP